MNPSPVPLHRLLIANANPDGQWNFDNVPIVPAQQPQQPLQGLPITIKLPGSMPSTRSSARQRADSIASGSEYHASNASMDVDDQEDIPDDEEAPVQKPDYTISRHGRKVIRKSYKESESEDNPAPDGPDEDDDEVDFINQPSDDRLNEAQDHALANGVEEDDDDDDGNQLRYTAKRETGPQAQRQNTERRRRRDNRRPLPHSQPQQAGPKPGHQRHQWRSSHLQEQ